MKKRNDINLSGFDQSQQRQIRLGLMDNLDVSIYAHHYYNSWQMNEIRLALLSNHPYVSKIANPELDAHQMYTVRKKSLHYGDPSPYAKSEYTPSQMNQIALGLRREIDIKKFSDKRYTAEQMVEIRKGLINDVDITPFITFYHSPSQMREIRLGLEAGLKVEIYSNYKFTGSQMRRIREAMIEGLDYSEYLNNTYTTKAERQVIEENRK